MDDHEKIHERGNKYLSAYIAFIIGLLLAVAFKDEPIKYSNWIIGLSAISIPSLIAIIFLDHTVRVRQQRKKSAFRGFAYMLGFLPSLISIILLIAAFSMIAAMIFGILIVFWIIVLDVVTFIGFKYPQSNI